MTQAGKNVSRKQYHPAVKRTARILAGFLLLGGALVYWVGRRPLGPSPLEPQSTDPTASASKDSAPLETAPGPGGTSDLDSRTADLARVELRPRRETGPFTIEGAVVRRIKGVDTPIADALVTLADGSNAGEFSPQRGFTERIAPVLSQTRTGMDGHFDFVELAQGQHLVATRTQSGDSIEALVQVFPEFATAPKRFALLVVGTASIQGTLRDVRGAPIECARVMLQGRSYERGAHGITWRATDSEGKFTFGSLDAGRYSVIITAQDERSPVNVWPGRSHWIELAEGESVTLDAGIKGETPHWKGVVRTSGGPTISGDMNIGSKRIQHFPLGSEVTTDLSWQLRGEGGFDLRVDAGEWAPSVTFWGNSALKGTSWKPRRAIHVDSAGLTEDIVTGSRLEGRVLVAGTGQRPEGQLARMLSVRLYRSGDPASKPERKSSIDEHGAFAFNMLEAGEWVLETWPRKLTAEANRVTVHILPDEAVHKVELEVESR